jgi:hypothetical protein
MDWAGDAVEAGAVAVLVGLPLMTVGGELSSESFDATAPCVVATTLGCVGVSTLVDDDWINPRPVVSARSNDSVPDQDAFRIARAHQRFVDTLHQRRGVQVESARDVAQETAQEGSVRELIPALVLERLDTPRCQLDRIGHVGIAQAEFGASSPQERADPFASPCRARSDVVSGIHGCERVRHQSL